MTPPIGYIAYIDEAGDDGLERVKPADPNGASEWFVLSCMLIRADREDQVLPFLKDLIGSFKQHQIKHLHFRQLREDKKYAACEYISELPVRLFSIISNKRNMRGYLNLRASQAKINVTAWFYCWMMRVLIERVSDYCSRRSVSHHGGVRPIRFEISSRGGVRIGDVTKYLKYLKDQDELGLLFNDYWVPCWPVIDFNQFHVYPAKERAGLQFADCVASAFFQALKFTSEGFVKPEFAKTLRSRMCMSKRDRIYDFGFKILPSHVRMMARGSQLEILDFYQPL